MAMISTSKNIAIKPIKSTKIETQVVSGIAKVVQRSEVIIADLFMDYYDKETNKYYSAKTSKVILHGDSGFQAWNKKKFLYKQLEFVLVPYTNIIGFIDESH